MGVRVQLRPGREAACCQSRIGHKAAFCATRNCCPSRIMITAPELFEDITGCKWPEWTERRDNYHMAFIYASVATYASWHHALLVCVLLFGLMALARVWLSSAFALCACITSWYHVPVTVPLFVLFLIFFQWAFIAYLDRREEKRYETNHPHSS